MSEPKTIERRALERWLISILSDVSENEMCSSWDDGTVHNIYRAMLADDPSIMDERSSIDRDDLATLRQIVAAVGGWGIYRSGGTFPEIIPLAEWTPIYEKREAANVIWRNEHRKQAPRLDLFCPKCKVRHVDVDDGVALPHSRHKCLSCGERWYSTEEKPLIGGWCPPRACFGRPAP